MVEMIQDESNLEIPKCPIKVYRRRWAVLTILILYSLANSFMWVEYSIITNVVVKYYNVSSTAVNWTAIIYLVMYPIVVIPASYIIDTQGLRTTALIGGIGTALAAIVKVFSVRQDLFYVVLIGQALGSTAQAFILCLPPKIAAVWFPPSELSLANSLGIFGQQLGFGLGFLIPSTVVKNSDDINAIGADLYKLCWIVAIYIIPVTLAIIIYFPKEPKLPPSVVQAESRTMPKLPFKEFLYSFKNITSHQGFLLHLAAFSINIGVYSAFTTFLNQFVLQYFENAEEDAGRMGLLSVVAGLIGTILFGVYLDKTHKYKESNLLVCYMTAISMLALTFAIKMQSLICTYLSCVSIGFFINSYMATGIELAVELTFPSDESTITNMLVASNQAFGVLVSSVMGLFNQRFGAIWSLGSLAAFHLIGAVLTQLVPNIKRRQEALKEENEKSITPLNGSEDSRMKINY